MLARADRIDVWFEAPGKHLIQDPATKIVHGVIAEVGGREVKVRAKNGVVLTCGGYENNPQMQQDYNDHTFYPSLGRALYNTGDGIKMAQEIGADLWHMGNIVTTNGEFYDPETQTATSVFMIYAAACGMVVGGDGTRLNEDNVIFGRGGQKHGKVWAGGNYKKAWLPDEMYNICRAYPTLAMVGGRVQRVYTSLWFASRGVLSCTGTGGARTPDFYARTCGYTGPGWLSFP